MAQPPLTDSVNLIVNPLTDFEKTLFEFIIAFAEFFPMKAPCPPIPFVNYRTKQATVRFESSPFLPFPLCVHSTSGFRQL